ncbi:hypothetical protein SAY87_016297 [Trapa incisa]|uniref:Kinesin motor domain-containing protein n=1 Tax=Trapa incisa TaxID=236973 RepID=A0AAN7L6K7_9MYRT|nr:hypothetical protein SAY87_016297 [Trapa incisa]
MDPFQSQQSKETLVSKSPWLTPQSSNKPAREMRPEPSSSKKHDKDKGVNVQVFGPTSPQKDLYDQAVNPIVNEVFEGYNCTVFAYGQTGTGKTYTMEGGAKKKNGEFPSDAGVIPRAITQIFNLLEAQCADYSIKVTFLELYNEEITDLLAPEECSKSIEDRPKKPLTLMEDGKG